MVTERHVNCLSYALYTTGVTQEEAFAEPADVQDILAPHFIPVATREQAVLVAALEYPDETGDARICRVIHAAVIEQGAPLVTEREKGGAQVRRVPESEAMARYPIIQYYGLREGTRKR